MKECLMKIVILSISYHERRNDMKRPRIMFFIADTQGCGYYRVVQPAKGLKNWGYDVAISDIIPEKIDADIVVFQRQISSAVLKRALKMKEQGIKVVFELDDYYHGIPRNNPASAETENPFKQALKVLETFIHISDAFIVSTHKLKEMYYRYNKNIHVIENCVNPDLFEAIQKPKTDDKITIGWYGSPTHLDDLKLVVNPLRKIVEANPNVVLKFFGYCPISLFFDFPQKQLSYSPPSDIFFFPFSLKNQDFTIGIAPLTTSDFNDCKSDLKWLEMSACKFPSIVSKCEAYKYVKNGITGLSVSSEKEWEEALEYLVSNETKRLEIAKNAHDYVTEKRNIKNNIQEYSAFFDSLVNQPALV